MGWHATDDREPLARRPRSRKRDPETSKEAARLAGAHLDKLQRLVLEAYRELGPMSARTAEELERFDAYGHATIRKRVSELAAEGFLRPAGTDRSRRAPCTIYEAVPLEGTQLELGLD